MSPRLHPRRPERGATLVVTLIMLVIMTLFAIAAVNLSGSNLKVIGNMQARTAAESAAQWAIEDTLSSINWFRAGYATERSVVAPNGLTARVQGRSCKSATPVPDNTNQHPILPEETVWEFRVEVTDPQTNAKAVIWQGARIKMLAGNCL
jgi:Tfp pilus assembly protein PilX